MIVLEDDNNITTWKREIPYHDGREVERLWPPFALSNLDKELCLFTLAQVTSRTWSSLSPLSTTEGLLVAAGLVVTALGEGKVLL